MAVATDTRALATTEQPRRRRRSGGRRSGREDAVVRRFGTTCVVCRLSRRDDAQHEGDVFICAQCQADAKQFLEIQDRIWPGASETGGSIDEPNDPTPL